MFLFAFSSTAKAAAAVADEIETAEAKAVALARLVHPQELALATGIKAADDYLVPSLLKQPDIADMEAEYPGIVKTMYVAARPILIEIEQENVARMQTSLSRLYLAELSLGEIEEISRFFAEPTGRKVVRGMFNSNAMQNSMEAIAAAPDAPISIESIRENQVRAAVEMAAGMNEEDERTAGAFLATSAGKKFGELGPRARAIAAEIVNAPQPKLQARVDAAMLEAAESFMVAEAKE